MSYSKSWLAGVLVAAALVGVARAEEQTKSADAAVFGVFVGSTPGEEPIRPVLQLPATIEPPIRWRLTLFQDPKTQQPAGYHLRCDWQALAAAKSGSEPRPDTREKKGAWTIGKGTKANPEAIVYELNGLTALVQVDRNLLHLLNRDRTLMVGNGGWSYSLYRAEAAEKPGEPPLEGASYTISPLATGPSVFGVFEGRTPSQGISRELKVAGNPGGIKAKWRVTLYQDPDTQAPTTYKIEGTLFRQGARQGKWTIVRGTKADPKATIYRLEPTKTQPALSLLQGDENVLFFLDQNQQPMVGHADFSYTLNRRTSAPATPDPK